MSVALQYIIDNNGKTKSVLVPLKEWEKLNDNYTRLQKKLDVINSIKQGLVEINNAKRTGKKLQTLKDFLSESNS
jgi:hypothetical protein